MHERVKRKRRISRVNRFFARLTFEAIFIIFKKRLWFLIVNGLLVLGCCFLNSNFSI
jgi:hypothetical protein